MVDGKCLSDGSAGRDGALYLRVCGAYLDGEHRPNWRYDFEGQDVFATVRNCRREGGRGTLTAGSSQCRRVFRWRSPHRARSSDLNVFNRRAPVIKERRGIVSPVWETEGRTHRG